jgi:hypothetical protein
MSSVIPGMHLHPVRTAWLGLVVALALHVADEALTGFLDVYNPTVRALREQLRWFPMPEFRFDVWLAGLVALVIGLAILTPIVERGPRVARAVAVVFAGLMVLNGTAHIAGTVAGQTVATVRFDRPMSGFWSSPFLIAAAVHFIRVRTRW